MFRDLDGIHVPNSFDGKRLHKAILNRSANGEKRASINFLEFTQEGCNEIS